jgi:hypothetical protein
MKTPNSFGCIQTVEIYHPMAKLWSFESKMKNLAICFSSLNFWSKSYNQPTKSFILDSKRGEGVVVDAGSPGWVVIGYCELNIHKN